MTEGAFYKELFPSITKAGIVGSKIFIDVKGDTNSNK